VTLDKALTDLIRAQKILVGILHICEPKAARSLNNAIGSINNAIIELQRQTPKEHE
jgi:hypothetical protein